MPPGFPDGTALYSRNNQGKDDATGAVTVTYSEPEGFPFHFHWTATVALDGTTTTTPMVIGAGH